MKAYQLLSKASKSYFNNNIFVRDESFYWKAFSTFQKPKNLVIFEFFLFKFNDFLQDGYYFENSSFVKTKTLNVVWNKKIKKI